MKPYATNNNLKPKCTKLSSVSGFYGSVCTENLRFKQNLLNTKSRQNLNIY